ncbi:MAG TPA: DUF547 domain-containing protein [Chthoniobacteraceae bacterium]|jgi:hypothetical protein
MKTSLLSALFALAAANLLSAAGWEEEYAGLLKKYVTPSGVRYAAWKANPGDLASLRHVVDGIAGAPAPAGKGSDALAFHLNAYNAWILQEALEKYPTKSVKDPLFTFFIGNRITVAGQKMSFNRLEKEIIIPRYGEPRVHVALNCASRSCPPLRNEPYTGAKMNAQLDSQSKTFVESSNGVRPTEKGAELSAIFDWYKEDFGGAGGVLKFINKYRSTPVPDDARISFQNYDWRLNEAS